MTRANPAIVDLIGSTPLIRLHGPSERTGCEILGKAEFLNPGGSVKDRTALGIIREAERSGALKPGGVIVEGTAGNTGIGLALVGGALGYGVVIVMPTTQSAEKKQALMALGCEVIEVDPAPFSSENHFVHTSRRLAQKLNETEPYGAIWANQFDNPANKGVHAATTGVEIWDQTEGKIDAFICAAGTGGTIAGVSEALRARKDDIIIGLADPAGASLYSYYTTGTLASEGSSITEGIGVGRITGQLDNLKVDHAFRILDEDFLPVLFDLVTEEGLSLGGSAGVNVTGAIELAKTLGPGKTIVTMLCDSGSRYAGRLYNPDYLQARGLPTPPWRSISRASGLIG
ncbi:cysteine synthase A [Woodsholea maritima]|uniref:cysteine synthase A n=1 Tax=Woodsholea maritima TaxID=240237 RepID=UPI00035D84B1|nr:cysteine synthase A [Woodsholea maritima]